MSAETPQFDDELLSAYLDDELAPEERARVEARLAADPAARQLLDELLAVSRAVKALPKETLPADLSEAVLRRAERTMLSSSKPPGEPASAGGFLELARKIPIGRSRRSWFWAGAAIAAGLLIMIFEKQPEQDAEVPGGVAMHDVREVGKLPPLEMRAAKDESMSVAASRPNESTGLAAKSVEAPPVAGDDVHELRRDEFAAENRAGGAETNRFFGGGQVAVDGTATDAAKGELSGRAQNSDLLVVHVNAKPEALERKLFDGVLARNGIFVEDAVAEAAPAAGQVQRTLDSSSKVAAAAGPQSPEPPARMLQVAPNVDVVLVEAEPAQIAGCLTELDADRSNYLGIEVEDQRSSADQLAEETESIDWKQHNRGVVPPEQKVQLAPDNNLYLNTEGRQIAIGNYAAQTPLADADAATTESLDRTTQRGRATRMQQPQSDYAWGGKGSQFRSSTAEAPGNSYGQSQVEGYDLARRAMQKIAAKADTLQVLFVLTCPTEHAEPAAAPAAAPATSSPASSETVP